jgi:hypothetical protein
MSHNQQFKEKYMLVLQKLFYSIPLALGLVLVTVNTAKAEAVVKEVCKDKVGKDGKPVKDKKGEVVKECKKINTHKKVEGEKVPDSKK